MACTRVFIQHPYKLETTACSSIGESANQLQYILFAVPWTVVYQAHLSMEFSRQQYWSGQPFPSPGDLPNPGIKPRYPASPALVEGLLTTESSGKPITFVINLKTYGHLLHVRLHLDWASLMAQSVKNLPVVQETRVQSLRREAPLEKAIATHSSVLAWRIPWTEGPGGLQSTGSQKARHD